MDDAIAILLTTTPTLTHVQHFFAFMVTSFYEHDQEPDNRRFILKPEKDDDKYLDADVLVSKDKRFIKLVYHNKNASILSTHEQDVGRFLNKNACAPYAQKISAIASVIARAHRFTSHEHDLHNLLIQIQHECFLLHYTQKDICLVVLAAIRMLHKTDKCKLYITLASALRTSTSKQH